MRLFAEHEQSAIESFLSQGLGNLYAGLTGAQDQDRCRRLHGELAVLGQNGRTERNSALPIRKSHGQSIERARCDQLA
jgi:hypothetical protein